MWKEDGVGQVSEAGRHEGFVFVDVQPRRGEVSGAQAYSWPLRNTMPAIPKRPGAYNDYDYARAEYR